MFFVLLCFSLVVLIQGKRVIPFWKNYTIPSGNFTFPNTELYALEDFYVSLQGDSWTWRENITRYGYPWNFTTTNVNPCLDYWQGIRCYFDQINNLSTLSILRLNAYNLQGTIPNSIVNWTTLISMNLNYNSISGTVPSLLPNMTNLRNLGLYFNEITGSLPTNIGNLTQLSRLVIGFNYITGTLPSSIQSLPLLYDFDVSYNNMIGTIPSWFGNLTELKILRLALNDFTGTIPQEFLHLSNLKQLFLSLNWFSGSIPSSLFEYCPELITLYLEQNSFTGHLPELPNNVTYKSLINYEFGNNLFSGTLPLSYANAKQLLYLVGNDNQLTGSLPSEYSELQHLDTLILGDNYLTHEIPQTYLNLTNITYFAINNNQLYGPLQVNISQYQRLFLLEIESNYFQGEFPLNNNQSTSALNVFNASSNCFSGTIPLEHQISISLTIFDISNNIFTGSINEKFNHLIDLRLLFLQNNYFVGSITQLINNSIQLNITNIDISENNLSGSFPMEIFLLPKLQSLAAVQNCFIGSISSTICQITSLISLALDGLHSSSECVHDFFPNYIHTYPLGDAIVGSLPLCLFSMPNLNTLHVSGNGLTGSLPNSLPVNSSLMDLTISHNNLIGTIPYAFQSKLWNNFDLSFNRFTGLLSTSLGNAFTDENQIIYTSNNNNNQTNALSLQVNFLSGNIPIVLKETLNINILRGSLFNCHYTKNNLPVHDVYSHRYSCGSHEVNLFLVSYVVCLVSIFVGIIVWILWRSYFQVQLSNKQTIPTNSTNPTNPTNTMTWMQRKQWIERFFYRCLQRIFRTNESWWRISFYYAKEYPSIAQFMYINQRFRELTFVITLVCFVVFLPIYVALTTYYGTYDQQYIWIISAIFLQGQTPAIVLFICYFCFLYGLDSYVQQMLQSFRFYIESESRTITITVNGQDSDEKKKENNEPNDNSRIISIDLSEQEKQSRLVSRIITVDSIFQSCKKFIHVRSSEIIFVSLCLIMFLINIFIVMTVNILYVYATNENIRNEWMVVITFCISGFKIYWNNQIVLKTFFYWLQFPDFFLFGQWKNPFTTCLQYCFASKSTTSNTSADPSNIHGHHRKSTINFLDQTISPYYYPGLSFLFILAVFNYIGAPLFSDMTMSSRCFYYMVVPPPIVTSTYSFQSCEEFGFIAFQYHCLKTGLTYHNRSYQPPFSYSYHCSSNIMTNFAIVFLIRYFVSGLLMPLYYFLVKYSQESRQHIPNKPRWEQLIYLTLPSMLRVLASNLELPHESIWHDDGFVQELQRNKPVKQDIEAFSIGESVNPLSKPHKQTINNDEISSKETQQTNNNSNPSLSTFSLDINDWLKINYEDIFDIETYLIINLTDIAVLLTFGVIFPPLALLILITIWIQTTMNQLMIGRLMRMSKQHPNVLESCIQGIEKKCDLKYLLVMIDNSTRWIVLFTVFFWAFYLFDILGLEVGWKASLWIVFLTIAFPLIIRVINNRIIPCVQGINRYLFTIFFKSSTIEESKSQEFSTTHIIETEMNTFHSSTSS